MDVWDKAKKDPEILREEITPQEVTLHVIARKDLFQFQGHFPEKAIFPGVAQLDWAVQLGETYFQHGQSVTGVNQLKFRKLIEPEIELVISLKYLPEKSQIKFTFGVIEEKDCFSSGIIKLSAK